MCSIPSGHKEIRHKDHVALRRIQVGAVAASGVLSVSMAAGILVVVGYRAAALVHLIMLAAMVMMTLRNPVLHNRTMLVYAAMLVLG